MTDSRKDWEKLLIAYVGKTLTSIRVEKEWTTFYFGESILSIKDNPEGFQK